MGNKDVPAQAQDPLCGGNGISTIMAETIPTLSTTNKSNPASKTIIRVQTYHLLLQKERTYEKL